MLILQCRVKYCGELLDFVVFLNHTYSFVPISSIERLWKTGIIYTSLLETARMKSQQRSQEIFQKLCQFIDEGDQKSVEALLKVHHRRLTHADTSPLFERALHSKNPHLAYNLYRHIPLGHLSNHWYFKNADYFMCDSMAQGREDVAAVLCIVANQRIGNILNIACATLAANNIGSLKRWQNSSNDNIVLQRTQVDASALAHVEYDDRSRVQDLAQKAVDHPESEFCKVLAAYPEFLPLMLQYSMKEHQFERYCDILDASQSHRTLSAKLLKTVADASCQWNVTDYSFDHIAYYTALFDRIEPREWKSYVREKLHYLTQPYCSHAMLDMFEVAYRYGGDRVFHDWETVVPNVHPNNQEWASCLSKFILEQQMSAVADKPNRKSKM